LRRVTAGKSRELYQSVFFSPCNRGVREPVLTGSHSGDPVQSTSMQRLVVAALLASAFGMCEANAQPMPLYSGNYPAPSYYRQGPDLGGGFIEFLFGGGHSRSSYSYQGEAAPPAEPVLQEPLQPPAAMQQPYGGAAVVQQPAPNYGTYARIDPATAVPQEARQQAPMDPRFLPQVVHYNGPEKPGTIIIDTPKRFLFLVEADGKAIRYGIGVGRPGFTWAGVKQITSKREWPDWRPPDEMLQRRPDLPRFMAGGPDNPLGARAMYLGSSLYRIHGSNEPWTIGHAVSSGCIRMRNEDVIDLYQRVKVGTKVVVI
jgi:lipoprotein-anchoring transpeptidase ErfK/SrfK